MDAYVFDVALSFAGEDRDFVRQVADQLRANGVRVFYDEYERANLWGKELIGYLEDVYKNKSKYVIIFVSKAYLSKDWTNHELKSALNRAFTSKREYILPVKLDDTKLPGLHESISHLDAENLSATGISKIFLEKIGVKNITNIPSILLLYRITRRKFADDISGKGAALYGTRWSSKGNAVFFTATSVSLATLEVAVNLRNWGNAKDFVIIQYLIPSSVPIEKLYESDLPKGWNKFPYPESMRKIGDHWLQRNESCILSIPSVVVKQERNYLLNPNHSWFKELSINKIEDFEFDQRLLQ